MFIFCARIPQTASKTSFGVSINVVERKKREKALGIVFFKQRICAMHLTPAI